MKLPAAAAPSLLLFFGLLAGLWGIRWGLPGPERFAAFPPELISAPDAARRFAESWQKLYEDIRTAHREMRPQEPVTYVVGVDEIAPGWGFPPEKLLNSYRSMLLRSENPDERKAYTILAQMRPWKLDFKPLYLHYGGAFIYPLGAFLKLISWTGFCRLVPDVAYYIQHPEEMGRLYLAGRIFILLFHLASLLLLYEMGRRLGDWRGGLLAGLFFLWTPFTAVNTHLLKPHPYAAFWVLASVIFCLKALRAGQRASYTAAGFCAGLAAGANFGFVCFAAMPILVWILRRRQALAAEKKWALFAAAAAALACVASNPYLLLAYGDFRWEREILFPPGSRFNLAGLPAMLVRVFPAGMGPLLAAAAGVGVATSLTASRERRFLAWTWLLGFLWIWARFWYVAPSPAHLRLFYPLIGVGCVLAADVLSRGPRALAAGLAALILADGGMRAAVYLENMRLGGGLSSTRHAAGRWIDDNIPRGSSVGLIRYPEPAHTPPFRYDRYRLLIFQKPESLKRPPSYLVVDGLEKPSIDNWAQKNYDELKSFLPACLAWYCVGEDDSFFANGSVYVFRRKG